MWTPSVVVHPWIGVNYENPKFLKYRTLILGESNFTSPPENFNSSLVIRCVKDDVAVENPERDTTGFCRFSTKLRRVIFGSDEVLGPEGLWNDVAFYNFVQSLVGEQARVRPTSEMWRDSVPAFFEIMATLEPSRVLVLGKANWENLLQHVAHDIESQYVAKLNVDGQIIMAGYINHPSSSMKYSVWGPVARQFLLE